VTLKPAGRPIHSALGAYCHLVTTRYPVSRAAMCLAPKELAQAASGYGRCQRVGWRYYVSIR
jgi:hypothetical protein